MASEQTLTMPRQEAIRLQHAVDKMRQRGYARKDIARHVQASVKALIRCGVAQVAERRPVKSPVDGSNPSPAATEQVG